MVMVAAKAQEIARQFGRLLGCPCLIIEGQAVHFRARERSVLLPFENSLGGAHVLVIVEHQLAVMLVGAVEGNPIHHLDQRLQSEQLNTAEIQGLLELMKRLHTVFQEDGLDLSLGQIHLDPFEERRPDIEALLMGPAVREDFQLTIEGYGAGRLSVLSA